MTPEPLLEFRQASCGYPRAPVLSQVNLSVAGHDVVALVGPNGSGKSTLIKTALGLADLLAGDVLVFGHPVGDSASRGRVGYVPQHSAAGGVVPTTVREVVTSGRLVRSKLFRPLRASDKAAVAQALDRVGLADLAQTQVSTLSGGQQRRTLIARALASEPDLLVLDEPLAGVDLASQDQLASTLGELVAAGTTLVIVLHELGPLRSLVTRIARLRGGHLVYDGPVTADVLGQLHEDELGRHDHHHADETEHQSPGPDLGLTRP